MRHMASARSISTFAPNGASRPTASHTTKPLERQKPRSTAAHGRRQDLPAAAASTRLVGRCPLEAEQGMAGCSAVIAFEPLRARQLHFRAVGDSSGRALRRRTAHGMAVNPLAAYSSTCADEKITENTVK